MLSAIKRTTDLGGDVAGASPPALCSADHGGHPSGLIVGEGQQRFKGKVPPPQRSLVALLDEQPNHWS
jgi:hypothetical protein